MEQPEGFITPSFKDHVWELQMGLYGMKQGGLVWNKTLNEAMLAWGFTHLKSEHCIYLRRTEAGILLIAVHVDDFFTVSSTKQALSDFKAKLCTKWQVAELGDAHFCLSIAIDRDRAARTISLSQTVLIDCIITQFGLAATVTCTVPMEPGLQLSRQNHSPCTIPNVTSWHTPRIAHSLVHSCTSLSALAQISHT